MMDELIERFFKKQCTAGEATQVVNYFKDNPSLLDEYLSEKEWYNTEQGESLPEGLMNEIWAKIIKDKKANVVVIWIKRTAVAASIAGLIGIGYYTLMKSEIAGKKAVNIVTATTRPLLLVTHKVVTNNTTKVDHILLMDSSNVDLYPGSQISYIIPFQNNKREIYLRGEAFFKVTKDKTKPFTVYAGKLSTTALGTAFRIITKKNSPGNIIVKLFTGKVAIRSNDFNLKGWSKDVYLFAGQQMSYDAKKKFVSIEKINSNKMAAKTLPVTAPDNIGQLTFNGASLSSVIDKLSSYFNIKIAYNRSLLNGMSFTGVITKNDSLQNVLNVIAKMNDLEIEQKDNRVIIKQIQK